MKMDMYKHLNDRDGVVVGIEEIAVQVEKMNYGTHRMLSALVRARRANHPKDELADALQALLERGFF